MRVVEKSPPGLGGGALPSQDAPPTRHLLLPLVLPPPHPGRAPPISLRVPALTAAGPAPLAAVARLTRNAFEAPGFVLAFAIGAGARVPTLVNVCTGERRRTRLGTSWLVRRSGYLEGLSPTQIKNRMLGASEPRSERLRTGQRLLQAPAPIPGEETSGIHPLVWMGPHLRTPAVGRL